MKIKTKILQKMLSKVMLGVSNNKLIPITSLIELKLSGDKLSITATDRVNFIKVTESDIKSKDFTVVVVADILNNLIQKITTDEISFKLLGDCLEIKAGKGVYKFELPLGEDGSLIKYPAIPEFKRSESGVIKKEDVNSLLAVNKACLSQTLVHPWLTGYHLSPQFASSGDTMIAAVNTAVKWFKSNFLMDSNCVKLLGAIDDKEIKYVRNGDEISFITDTVEIYSVELEDEDKFPYEDISAYFDDINSNSQCQLVKSELLSALSRVLLFVKDYEDNEIILNFSKTQLSIKSKKSTGSEVLKYKDCANVQPFECNVNAKMLEKIVSVQPDDFVNLYFGDEACLKFASSRTKHLVALQTEVTSESLSLSLDEDIELGLSEDEVPF